MPAHSEPPGYRRTAAIRRFKLDGFTGIIDQILEDEKASPKKPRHAAVRIFARLHDEHGFSGGRTIVADYAREAMLRGKEVFVPLCHDPGHARRRAEQRPAVFWGKRHLERFAGAVGSV